MKKESFLKRKIRTRLKIKDVGLKSRLTVHKSNKYFYAQVIDEAGKTIVYLSEKNLGKLGKLGKDSLEKIKELGKMVAEHAIAKKVKKVVFDKSGYKYHGKVKALAEGAREGGLEF